MDMIVYMVLAEAVVTLAAAAIAEFQVRVVGIRPAADGAFESVRLVIPLSFHLPDFVSEINRFFPLAHPGGLEVGKKPVPAEEQIVQYRDYGKRFIGNVLEITATRKKYRVQKRKPF
jgi:hypothetical protein